MSREEAKLGIVGEVRGFQTELDYVFNKNGILVPVDTGIVVPGTRWKKKNTILDELPYYLAYKIGTDTTDRALDDLFASDGTQAAVGAANNGKDGIVSGIATQGVEAGDVAWILATTLNTGGTEAENYIEYYGYIDGALTLAPEISIGHNYANAGNGVLTTTWSYTSISQVIAANRRYHHYWKFTISIT